RDRRLVLARAVVLHRAVDELLEVGDRRVLLGRGDRRERERATEGHRERDDAREDRPRHQRTPGQPPGTVAGVVPSISYTPSTNQHMFSRSEALGAAPAATGG